MPHPSRGETIKAYIVPKCGETIERTEIIAWCRGRLANYKVPRQVEFREELPKTLVGKILRRTLRAEEVERLRSYPYPSPEHDEQPETEENGTNRRAE